MAAPRIVVVGGTGFYGRYLIADVLAHSDAEVRVVARGPAQPPFPDPRVEVVAADHTDVAALARLVAGAAAVVHCAGPYQAMPGRGLPLGPALAAINAGVPYVDLAEDGPFRRAVLDVATGATAPVLTGASVVPGLQVIAVAELAAGLDRVDEIRCAAAPDTRRHRGPAMFRAMLHGLGAPFDAPRGGRPTRVYGWSEPEWVRFPPPVGRRLVYQVYEMADLAVLAELYGAGTISFKAGTEHAGLNRLLGWAAAARARTGKPRRAERFTPVVRGLSWLAGRVGNEAGGFLVEVRGARAERPVRCALGMTAAVGGGRMPSLLAGIAVTELLAGRLTAPGPVALDAWLSPERAWAELAARGVALWRDDGSGWQPL
ncbi:NAD(P)H-binding protein [Cryptosporangium minutisporangium]|uniref:NAD(P)-binding domain-containing protein n=1 Tax=Cryptosporangium minutisporangium TaxID=113569 RepID=A0ABP6SRT0_9ACTN